MIAFWNIEQWQSSFLVNFTPAEETVAERIWGWHLCCRDTYPDGVRMHKAQDSGQQPRCEGVS